MKQLADETLEEEYTIHCDGDADKEGVPDSTCESYCLYIYVMKLNDSHFHESQGV